MEKKNNPMHIVARVALVAGMVILAVCAVFGALRILPTAVSSLASVGSALTSSIFIPSEQIIISLSNNSVSTGEQTHVSFEHKDKKTDGSYQFRFECQGKNLTMTIIDGGVKKEAVCGSKTPITNSEFDLIPHLADKNSFIDSAIFVDFVKTNEKSAAITGRTVLTVHEGAVPSSAVKNNTSLTTNTTAVQTATATPAYTAPQTNVSATVQKSDLYIITKDIGVVVNGIFVPRSGSFNSNETPAIRFDIGNQGNVATSVWQFTAVLPTSPAQVFTSPVQPSLAAGTVIEYTLTLNNLANTGTNIATINVDPSRTVNELSYTNNSASMTLVSNQGYSYNNYYNNYSNNYYYGAADLTGKVLAVGFIDRNTGQFNEASSIPSGSRAAVQIQIQNVGSSPTGTFFFTADLPTNTNVLYTSPLQDSLASGESRQVTVEFDYPTHYSNNNFIVHLDPNGSVNDSSRSNNTFNTTVYTY